MASMHVIHYYVILSSGVRRRLPPDPGGQAWIRFVYFASQYQREDVHNQGRNVYAPFLHSLPIICRLLFITVNKRLFILSIEDVSAVRNMKQSSSGCGANIYPQRPNSISIHSILILLPGAML